MLDVAEEFGFHIRAFHHALEAYKIRDLLAKEGVAHRHLGRLVGLQDGGVGRHSRRTWACLRRRACAR